MENNEHLNSADDKLKALFNDFEVPLKAAHWDKMQQSLDALDAETDPLDTLVRKKLENLETGNNINNWQRMAAALDNLDAEDAIFDHQIADRVARMEAEFKKAHWDMMQKRLDETFTLRGKIVKYKIAEISLLLLALFTVINVSQKEFSRSNKALVQAEIIHNDGQKSTNKSVATTSVASETKNNKTVDNQSFIIKNKAFQDALIAILPRFSNKNISAQENTIAVDNGNEVKEAVRVGNENPTVDQADNNVKAQSVRASSNAVSALSRDQALRPIHIAVTLPNLSQSVEKMQNIYNHDRGVTEGVVQELKTLKSNTLSIASLYEMTAIKPLKKKSRWWQLGVFGTFGKNQTYSDFVYASRKLRASDAQEISGYGLSISERVGKLDVGTGILVTNHSYIPPQIGYIKVELNPEFGELDIDKYSTPLKVNLSVVTIPLSINYYLLDKGRFALYTHAGAAFNFQKNLTTETDPNKGNSFTRTNSDALTVPTYVQGDFRIRHLLENKHNFFTTFQIGLGAEFKATPRVSLFVQPTVYQHFGRSGIGTLDDRINNFSVHFGLKNKLGRFSARY